MCPILEFAFYIFYNKSHLSLGHTPFDPNKSILSWILKNTIGLFLFLWHCFAIILSSNRNSLPMLLIYLQYILTFMSSKRIIPFTLIPDWMPSHFCVVHLMWVFYMFMWEIVMACFRPPGLPSTWPFWQLTLILKGIVAPFIWEFYFRPEHWLLEYIWIVQVTFLWIVLSEGIIVTLSIKEQLMS